MKTFPRFTLGFNSHPCYTKKVPAVMWLVPFCGAGEGKMPPSRPQPLRGAYGGLDRGIIRV